MLFSRSLYFGAVLCLAGCKVGLNATTFITDIKAVAAGGPAINTSAVLSLDVGSAASCETNGRLIANALAQGFSKIETLGCRAANFSTFADFRVAIPIQDVKAPITTALAVLTGIDDNKDVITVLAPDGKLIAKIRDALPNELTYLASGDGEPIVTVELQNDTGTPQNVLIQGAFLDDEPFQLPYKFEIAHRGTTRITLSSVANAALARGNNAMLFSIIP